jgi:hypothetical protein
MDAQTARELASRLVSGDRLTSAEERDLLQWLENDPATREELFRDEAMDSLLGCVARLQSTADDFVQHAVRRAATWNTAQQPVRQAVEASPAPDGDLPQVRKQVRIAGWVHRFTLVGANRWIAAIACSIAVLLLGTIGWRWLAPGSRGESQSNQPTIADQPTPPPGSPENKNPPQLSDRAFATLTQNADASWDTPRAEGDRLTAGVLRLAQGSAEIHFDKGTVVFLTGPAVLELCSADEVSLQHGSLNARVPAPAVGFSVATPLSRVVDLGTEFDVVVQDSGTITTLVHEGRVSFRPQREHEKPDKPIELAVGALDHVIVSVPDVAAPVLPLVTVAGGEEGRFLGMVSLDGKTAEFHSPEAFNAFHARVLRRLQRVPNAFRQQWPTMLERLAEGAAAAGKTKPERPELPAAKEPGRNAVPNVAGAGKPIVPVHTPSDAHVVEVDENGKRISISESKESGISVKIVETVNGKRKTTQVNAATAAELAGKNPYAHRLYRQYRHPRPKAAKARKE